MKGYSMEQGCCDHESGDAHSGSGHSHGGGVDVLLWGSALLIAPAYLVHLVGFSSGVAPLDTYITSVHELMNSMWWGVVAGILFVGVLGTIPREFVMAILGRGNSFSGICRATLAGLLFDLCSHGILLVGMKLYERGASLGQVMAFLIASPWNSISLTLILWSLVGFKWMMTFLLLSVVLALVSGVIFNRLVRQGILPENPHKTIAPEHFAFFAEARRGIATVKFDMAFAGRVAREGVNGSRMILRWLLFGVVLAALIRAFMSPEMFTGFFGPTPLGLLLTIVAATVIEVCSEGSTPIAADLLNRAHAPGNAFAFLMAGVATDYTEVMSLKETTKSWKIALFLPLVTVPQVVLISWLINSYY